MKMLRIGLLLGLMGAFTACGADSGGEDAPSYVGTEKSVMVTPAAGGELEAGAATLSIPPGAVTADVEVSVAVESKKGKPGEKDILIDVYEFGPNMQFAKPVELSFDMKGVNVDSDKGTVQVAWLEGDKWNTLPTTVKDGKAVAETTHFTPFTLVYVFNDDGEVVQMGGECSGAFEACGGDVSGTWEFSQVCVTAPNLFGGSDDPEEEDPFAMCEDKPSISIGADITGMVTFADGTFDLNQMMTVELTAKLPISCLETVGGADNVELFCTQFNGTLHSENCVATDLDGDGEGPIMQTEAKTGTYAVEGNTLTLTNDDAAPGEEPKANEFCVQGDTLTVRFVDDEGSESRLTATRK